MPRVVRNFFIEGNMGHTRIGSGPRGENGEFTVNIYIRDKGYVGQDAVHIRGVERGGQLILTVDYKGQERLRVERQRDADPAPPRPKCECGHAHSMHKGGGCKAKTCICRRYSSRAA